MPTRTRTRVTKTGGGFGGFAPNPTFDRDLSPEAFGVWQPQASEIHPPVLTSAPPSNPRPRPTPRPSPSFNVDPSGTGLTPSTLGGNTLASLPNERYRPELSGGSRVADLSGASGAAEARPTIASRGGRSPLFVSDPNEDWIGTDETGGGWARSDGPEIGAGLDGSNRMDVVTGPGGMENEPVLFEDPTRARRGPSVAVDAGVNSRPPTSPGYMANFGGGMTIGQFLNTPLAFLRLGDNRTPTTTGPVSGGDIFYAGTSAHTPGVGGGLEPGEVEMNAPSPEAEALGREESIAAGIPVSPEVRNALPVDPGSRFGNLNSPTGRSVYFDGRVWRPVSGAPVDVRWDPNNPNNSNFAVSETTKAYLAGGQDPGRPNNMAPFASEGRFLLDEEGNPTQFGGMQVDPAQVFRRGQDKSSPTLRATPAAQLAWNNYLRQTPEYKAWLKARGG